MSGPPQEDPVPKASLIPGAVVFYGLLAAAAWFWLRGRDRLGILGPMAFGGHGELAAAGAGLATGLGLTVLIALISRRSDAVRGCEARIRAMLGQPGDVEVLMLSLVSAVAEELFFRVAVQDAIGLPLAVIAYAVLNAGPGFLAWAPIAGLCAAAFGGMISLGLGLLAATTAHAIVNYLSLRRILTP